VFCFHNCFFFWWFSFRWFLLGSVVLANSFLAVVAWLLCRASMAVVPAGMDRG
jgi:hypothetical protein